MFVTDWIACSKNDANKNDIKGAQNEREKRVINATHKCNSMFEI